MTGEAGRAEEPVLPFETAAAWEAWLERHPAAGAVWIRFARKGSGLASVTHDEALDVALCHGWIDGQTRSDEAPWFPQRFTPRRPRSKWSRINCDRALALIAAGRMRAPGLAAVEAARADGRWEAAYEGQRRIAMPDDLAAALAASRRAQRFFDGLDSKNRYAVLYRIQDAKRPETRARRIAKYVAMLEAGETLH